MPSEKADIITLLRKEMDALQGLHSTLPGQVENLGLDLLSGAFPNGHFPLGGVHELISEGAENGACTAGFTCGILSPLMKKGAAAVWIGSSRTLFPPALKAFGIAPDQIIFMDLQREKDVLWAMEEALKCEGLAAVIGEMPELNFTNSRRFQLAVEQSRVTGFILRSNPRKKDPNACVSRWKITALPSKTEDELPGIGFPRWQVELQKIRNGKPGIWELEWAANRFREITHSARAILLQPKRKTG